MKRKRRSQVTCLCGAYEFPHRLSGGRCNGAAWAASYFEHDRTECTGCRLNTGTHCEAAIGQEKIRHCEGFLDHLRAEPDIRHPLYGKRLEDFLDRTNTRYPQEEGTDFAVYEIPF